MPDKRITTIPFDICLEFIALLEQSSPECLHSDGEASPEEAESRREVIHNRWTDLENHLGWRVTESEINQITIEGRSC